MVPELYRAGKFITLFFKADILVREFIIGITFYSIEWIPFLTTRKPVWTPLIWAQWNDSILHLKIPFNLFSNINSPFNSNPLIVWFKTYFVCHRTVSFSHSYIARNYHPIPVAFNHLLNFFHHLKKAIFCYL